MREKSFDNFFRTKKSVALSVSVGEIKKEATQTVAIGHIHVHGSGLELAYPEGSCGKHH